MAKRAFDLFLSLAGLLVLSPLLFLVAVTVKVSSRGPVLFRQERVGKNGRSFYICKFRSMVSSAGNGLSVTREGDPRITLVGRFLRKTKLDELPQLWNVLVGQMSFVGPRPEVPRFVNKYTTQQMRVLTLKPGITDPATLEFRSEEKLLRGVPDMERFYMEYCVPKKIELSLAYAENANVWKDLKIIIQTLLRLGAVGEIARTPKGETRKLPGTQIPAPRGKTVLAREQ